jgi:hypothetical protein
LAIGKDENDENPIIVDTRDISLSNYEKYNVFDYTLQADEATIKMIANEPREKVCFTSSSTMGVTTLNEEWRRKAALFKDGKHEWMVFLIFTIPKDMEEGASAIAAQGKFSFTINAENRGKLAEGMNFYDKQRFEKTPDNGMTTGIHKSNIGKIVCSNTKMTSTFDDASKVKTSFNSLAEGIYSRMYLKESMRNFYANYGQGKDVSGGQYQLKFYVDGSTTSSIYIDGKLSQDEALKMTNWLMVFAPTNDEDFKYDVPCVNRFAYMISELTPGKHKIKIEATAQYDINEPSPVIAETEIEINITSADRDAFVKKYGLQLPEKGLLATDAKLLADVKIVAGKDAIDVRCPNKWEEIKDAWGVVIRRETIVAYSYKDDKGRGKQDTFMIQQPKTSSGWGATNASASKTWYGLDAYLPLQNSK